MLEIINLLSPLTWFSLLYLLANVSYLYVEGIDYLSAKLSNQSYEEKMLVTKITSSLLNNQFTFVHIMLFVILYPVIFTIWLINSYKYFLKN